MIEILAKLKMILTGSWRAKPKKFPTQISDDYYAVIRLKRFDNLPVAIIWDKDNGGFAVSYEDQHMSARQKKEIQNEIENILVFEIAKIGENLENGNI